MLNLQQSLLVIIAYNLYNVLNNLNNYASLNSINKIRYCLPRFFDFARFFWQLKTVKSLFHLAQLVNSSTGFNVHHLPLHISYYQTLDEVIIWVLNATSMTYDITRAARKVLQLFLNSALVFIVIKLLHLLESCSQAMPPIL